MIRNAKTAAIIGSWDKDTGEDRSAELLFRISSISNRCLGSLNYEYLFARYEYEEGGIIEEPIYLLFGLDKSLALRLACDYDQGSIIWKDENYFGILTPENKEAGQFTDYITDRRVSDEDVRILGSIFTEHNPKKKWYKVVLKRYKPPKVAISSIRNMATGVKREKETVFELYQNRPI